MAEIIDFQARRLKKKFEDETYVFSAIDVYFPHIAQMQREEERLRDSGGLELFKKIELEQSKSAPFPRVPNG